MAGQPTPFLNGFQEAALGSLRYNTSQAGSPLPIVYGTCRVSINVLEFWGYKGGSGKGGKGGLSPKAQTGKKAATYSVFVAMGICQGPVAFTGSSFGSGGFNRIWANAGIAYNPATVGLNAYGGTDGQAPDTVFAAKDPNTPVLGYSGTCYVTGDPLQLGNSPALPNVSFEITGFQAGTAGPLFPNDANPSLLVQDLLTNARYGAGFPASAIDAASFADFETYCLGAGLAMSMLLNRLQPAARWLEEVCQLCVAAPVWSGAALKLVPYATASINNGNGTTWNPNLTATYSVSDRDYIDWGGESDPVIVTRADHTNITNWLSLEYYDSSNSFNANVAYAWDQSAIDAYGVRTEASIEAHSLTNIDSAQISAQLQLNRKQQVLNTYKFQLGWVFALLEPMDIIEISSSALGLSAFPVRITGVDENDNGELTITAEDLPTAIQPPGLVGGLGPGSSTPNVNALPGPVNSPIIFEPHKGLTGGQYEVWVIASGGSEWGGANIWISTDNSTFAMVGTVFGEARQGVLTASLPAYVGTNPDTTNTLSVDLTESQGELVSASATDASLFVTLCWVDTELVAYQNATLTGPFQYNLTTLYRNLFETTGVNPGSGQPFGYIGITGAGNPGIFRYTFPANLIGATVYVKFQGFNLFQQQPEDLASVVTYSYTLLGNGAT